MPEDSPFVIVTLSVNGTLETKVRYCRMERQIRRKFHWIQDLKLNQKVTFILAEGNHTATLRMLYWVDPMSCVASTFNSINITLNSHTYRETFTPSLNCELILRTLSVAESYSYYKVENQKKTNFVFFKVTPVPVRTWFHWAATTNVSNKSWVEWCRLYAKVTSLTPDLCDLCITACGVQQIMNQKLESDQSGES